MIAALWLLAAILAPVAPWAAFRRYRRQPTPHLAFDRRGRLLPCACVVDGCPVCVTVVECEARRIMPERLHRAPSRPAPDPCAACGKRPAEFCDLCATCEEVQHQITLRGSDAEVWSGASLARVREAVRSTTCPSCGSAVPADSACALCRAEASL